MTIDLNLWWAKKSFSMSSSARAKMYLRLSKMLVNDVPLGDALSELNTIALRHGPKHPSVIMFTAWMKEINGGFTLGIALRGWVPEDESLLISAGESHGALPEMLIRAAENLKGKSQIMGALVGATAYPAILMLASTGLAWFFSTGVIPKFASILPADKWTGLAKITMSASGFVRDWFLVLIPMIAVIGVALTLSLSRWTGDKIKGRVQADKMIPWSVYRLMNGVGFMGSLSAMISAGTPLRDSLTKIEYQLRDNPYLKSRVSAILKEVRNGKDAGTAMTLTSHQFPDIEIIDELCIYGKYSGFDEALASISLSWRDEGVDAIKRKAGVLFITALLSMGGVVGFFTAGIFAIAGQVTESTKAH